MWALGTRVTRPRTQRCDARLPRKVEIPAFGRAELQTGDVFRSACDQSVAVDASSPSRSPMLRLAVVLLVACAGFIAGPAVAQADDLIQLNGDPPVTLGGTPTFGLLYLDGVVRLAANTSIIATDVFIGPDAQFQGCYDRRQQLRQRPLAHDQRLGRRRHLARPSTCEARSARTAPAARSSIRAARVSLGGGVETAGTNAQSGNISIDSPGLVVTQTLHAPGAAIVVHGGAGVAIGGDVWSAGSDTATGSDPARATNGGGIDLVSGSGDVSVLGSITSWGRDVTGAGAQQGGHGGPVNVVRRRRAHLGRHRLAAGTRRRPVGRQCPARSRSPRAASIAISGTTDASGDVSTSGNGSDGGNISMSAAGALAAGPINSMGATSTNFVAGGGGNVSLSAGAALSSGAINTAGAGSPQGGRHGGAVAVTGASRRASARSRPTRATPPPIPTTAAARAAAP